ncbi:MAG: hypothetical protein M8349_03520 [ANME-2 cluster archaeon]|nr:hypothetical protein [ANME-2 cluster archaeon]
MNKIDRPYRPEHGEWTPITVLNLENRTLGWSPKLKKNVHIDDSTNPTIIEELKRVREADTLIVYDQMRDRTVHLELKEPEREEFDSIYSQYLETGGQILYTREKEGRKTITLFMLEEEYGDFVVREVPEKKYLFK